MKLRFLDRYFHAARTISKDEDGIVLIWATILMVAIIALAGLALDASRYRSLKTQMQAGADALALAGARELDGSNGSITRATNAINNMISNTPEGMGTQSKITAATITFYVCLNRADLTVDPDVCPGAAAGAIGLETTNSNAAKYVGVTVSPASIEPGFVRYITLSADAMAVAGYDFALCNMPPVFICNPYEQQGDTNETANNRWMTQVSLPANQQQLTRLTVNGGSGYGPGHFGFLMPPSTDVTCNGSGGSGGGASSLACWIGKVNPPACYKKKAVDLNTGQMQSVFDAFNVRFDMYGGNIKATSDYAPAINVRKGYLPGTGANGACKAAPAGSPNPGYGVIVPQVTISGTVDAKNAALITMTSTPAGTLYPGSMVSDSSGYVTAGTTIQSISGNLITLSTGVSNSQKGNPITIVAGGPDQYANAQANAVPFPLDLNMIGPGNTVSPGNGQWDCQDYWKIVHGTTPPSGCGDGAETPTTVSRFQIYQMESSLLNDVAGPGAPAGTGEIGGPTCNPPGIAADSGGGDRRTIYAAVINCMANNSLMTGGQTANNIPVAGFGKFFMTQPVVDGQTLVGEMSGAVGLDKNAKNNVQLYR